MTRLRTALASAIGLGALLIASTVLAGETIDLDSVPGDVRILGDEANGIMGFSVASGEINGDEYEDFVLGAPAGTPYAGTPDSRAAAGKVYIIYGGEDLPGSIDLAAGGAPLGADVVIYGALAGGQLGRHLTVGDIDGDNVDDLILGAPFSSPKGPDQVVRTGAGSVHVIFGRDMNDPEDVPLPPVYDLLSTPADVRLIGSNTEANHNFGARVATGKVDDGDVADLIVSAPRADVGSKVDAGHVYIILGGDDLGPDLDMKNSAHYDFQILGAAGDDRIGEGLAVGDVLDNADPDDDTIYEDIVVGMPGANRGAALDAGQVCVIRGRALMTGSHNLATSVPGIRILGAAAADVAGRAVAVGDLNYDGLLDIVVGANAADPDGRTTAGEVYVLLGGDYGADVDLADPSQVSVNIWGPELAAMGWSLAIVNYNGDGMDDLVIGGPFAATAAGANAGWIAVIEGSTVLPGLIDLDPEGADQADLIVLGDDAGDAAGFAVRGGDLNGDGVDELLFGAVGATQAAAAAGEAYVLYGTPPHVELSAPDTTATYNEDLAIPITVDVTSGLKMVDVELDLLFDPALLAFDAIGQEGTLTVAWTTAPSVLPGDAGLDTLRVRTSTTGVPSTTTGTLFDLNFTMLDIREPASSVLTVDRLWFNGGPADWSEVTGPAWYVDTDGSVKLVGNDGRIDETIVIAPGDTVRLRVVDVDLNLDDAELDNVVIEVVNAATGEREEVTLHEFSPADSVFFGAVMTTASGPGVDGDDVLYVVDDDSLLATYDDVLDAAGVGATRDDSTVVIDPLGDANNDGVTQAYDAVKILFHAADIEILAGRDSMAANVDLYAYTDPEGYDPILGVGRINSMDAALVLQRRLGIIGHLPVQEAASDNHPQPETAESAMRPATAPRVLAVVVAPGSVTLRLDERADVIAVDLVVDGLGRVDEVLPASDLPGARLAYQRGADGSLRIAMAAEAPTTGPGDLLRIRLPAEAQPSGVRVQGALNGGLLTLRTSATAPQATAPPRELRLHANHPNPFNAETAIGFELPSAGPVRLEIFNGLGQRVRTLVDERLPSGPHRVTWDGADDDGHPVATGSYVYVLAGASGRLSRPLLLVK